jgi:hypothetical protein
MDAEFKDYDDVKEATKNASEAFIAAKKHVEFTSYAVLLLSSFTTPVTSNSATELAEAKSTARIAYVALTKTKASLDSATLNEKEYFVNTITSTSFWAFDIMKSSMR